MAFNQTEKQEKEYLKQIISFLYLEPHNNQK